jgi:hypothetical protein
MDEAIDNINNDKGVEFLGGARRSGSAESYRFDLIHPVAWIALARVCGEGADKYGPFNWERGMPVHDLMNHALAHYAMWLAGDRSEPHLEHAAWNAMACIVSDTLWPDLNVAHKRGPGCELTRPMLDHQEEMDPALAEHRRVTLDPEWTTATLAKVRAILLAGSEERARLAGAP